MGHSGSRHWRTHLSHRLLPGHHRPTGAIRNMNITAAPARLATIAAVWTATAVAVPVTASAEPPGFLDISGFTDVSTQYIDHDHGGNVARFFTPGGLMCEIASSGVGAYNCDGEDVPGFPANISKSPVDSSSCLRQSAAATRATNAPRLAYFQSAVCGSNVVPERVLHPGQKIVIPATSGTTVTCAVGEGDLTACTTGSHGFVLSPAGAWTF